MLPIGANGSLQGRKVSLRFSLPISGLPEFISFNVLRKIAPTLSHA